MKYYLYILENELSGYYVGITDNIDRRLQEHKELTSFHTKKFKKHQLVYQEEFTNRLDARKREVQLKGWSRAKKQALIEGNMNKLKVLSKSTS